jgi:ligand-binding sensor domain-containing protein
MGSFSPFALRLGLALWLILATSSPCPAQEPNSPPSASAAGSAFASLAFNSNTFNKENSDLPDNNVLCMAQASDGALWVGTEGGLARFQHGQWEVFRKGTIGCASDRIFGVQVTSDGAVWILISGYGYDMPDIARYYQGKWQVFDGKLNFPDEKFWDWLAAPDGVLWVGTDKGLSRFFEGKWQHFSNGDMGISHIKKESWAYDRALAATPDGAVYAGVSGAGLVRLQNGKWQLFTPENSSLPYDWVKSFRVGPDGALWMVTGGELVRFQQGQWQVYTPTSLGLPEDDFVADLTFAPDGAMWILGDGSLTRFYQGRGQVCSGNRPGFVKYKTGYQKYYLRYRFLTTSPDGTIWVADEKGGVGCFRQGRWQFFTMSRSLAHNKVNAFQVTSDGALWVGTQGGLTRLQADIWQICSEARGLARDWIDALTVAPDGAVWVGTARGLGCYQHGRWQVFTRENSALPDNQILSLTSAADGAVWVGTKGGLARWRQGQWQAFIKENSGLPDNWITALLSQPDGSLWVGTNAGGLARLQQGQWQVFTSENSSLPAGAVNAIMGAPDGALWIGTVSGLARLNRNHWQVFRQVTENYSGGGYFRMDLGVIALSYMADGALYASDPEGYLARYHRDKWQIDSRFHPIGGSDEELWSSPVGAMAVTPDGDLWLGTWGRGLVRLHQGEWQEFNPDNSDLPDNVVLSLAPAPDGNLWVGTRAGLACFRGKDQIFLPEASPLPSNGVTALTTTADGALWVGTGGGLAKFHHGSWESFTKETSGLPFDAIGYLAGTPGGALWVGNWGSGLARFHQGQWQVFTKENSLLHSNFISALAVSGDVLWVGTLNRSDPNSSGLYRYHNGKWQVFNKDNGLPSNNIVYLLPGPDGALWVSTEEGLARFQAGEWKVYRSIDYKTKAGTEGWANLFWNRLVATSDGALWASLMESGPQKSLLRFHQGQWEYLPFLKRPAAYNMQEWLTAFAATPDGALWLGASGSHGSAPNAGGLYRYHQGQWQVFNKDNCHLNDYRVTALLPCTDGTIWVGTKGGLTHFTPPKTIPQVELIPASEKKSATFAQPRQTFAAWAFDPQYLTRSQDFHYHWILKSGDKTLLEKVTVAPLLSQEFQDGREYGLEVRAIDKYGYQSGPKETRFRIALPQPPPRWQQVVQMGGISAGLLSLAYLLFLPPLIMFYPLSSLARTATNSGAFNRFPLIHKSILNSGWARGHLFRNGAQKYLRDLKLPSPYIPQAVFRAEELQAQPIQEGEVNDFLCHLCTPNPHALLLGRSGTGKSVLLRYLLQQALERFLAGTGGELPLLIDLRTHPLAGRQVEDIIADELKGHGLELPDETLRFWLKKGGFLILVDSLNEVDSKVIKNELQAFLNRDFHNRIVMASQLDLLERRDVQVFQLAEVNGEQARQYLREVLGIDLWERLAPEVHTLARNPQDLSLLGEVLQVAAPEDVPTKRAELYRSLLETDTALAPWVKTDNPEIRVIYELAFRMVDEGRRVLREDELADLLRSSLEAHRVMNSGRVAALLQSLERSRMFRREQERLLGLKQTVIGFAHELVGKFLASRHLRTLITDSGAPPWEEALHLTGEPRWLEVCFFAIDELPPGGKVLERFLLDLLRQGGALRLRLVAYAMGTRSPEAISLEVRETYNRAKMAEDLRETPAKPPVVMESIALGTLF